MRYNKDNFKIIKLKLNFYNFILKYEKQNKYTCINDTYADITSDKRFADDDIKIIKSKKTITKEFKTLNILLDNAIILD